MNSGDFFTLLSLFLTPLTVYASSMVVFIWWRPFIKAVPKKDKDSVAWMITGVVINFFGAILDNIWWGIAWSADYVNPESGLRNFMFDYGVHANTFSRQACGIAGALCHIRSGLIASDRSIKSMAVIGVVAGLLYVFALYVAHQPSV